MDVEDVDPVLAKPGARSMPVGRVSQRVGPQHLQPQFRGPGEQPDARDGGRAQEGKAEPPGQPACERQHVLAHAGRVMAVSEKADARADRAGGVS